MYSQLQFALLPRFQKDLNGMLVLLNNSHKPAPEPTQLVTFRKSVTTGPETINWIPYENSYQMQIVVGVSISVAMGLLISALALSVILKYSMHVLKKSHQAEMVKRRLVMMATGADALDEEVSFLFPVSMLYRLWCLESIRNVFWNVVLGMTTVSAALPQ